MLTRSRVNKPLLLLASLVLIAAGPAPAPKQPESRVAPPSQQYDQCLAQATANPKQALNAAESWFATGGGFPAQHCAAVALIGLKQYGEAAKRLQAMAGAMMTEPPTLRAATLDQAGQAYLLANQPDQAISVLSAALKLDNAIADYWIDRAEALAGIKKYWEAIDDLNRALELSPDDPDALIFRAAAYRNTGGADGLVLAASDADHAVKLVPDSAPALLERGNIRRLRGDREGARADWQRVTLIAPQSSAAQFARANLAHIDDGANTRLLTAPPKKN